MYLKQILFINEHCSMHNSKHRIRFYVTLMLIGQWQNGCHYNCERCTENLADL